MGAVLSAVWSVCKALWPVVIQLLPLLVKMFGGSATARDRAREIQGEYRKEVELMLEKDEDELSRREMVRARILRQLLMERRMRRVKPA